ncbi:28S ribosomal protein S11, mitochondrial isoform X1 [Hippocampus zosterae]|uniref:28S ribosomal protein S11, mitochondrial isoform X1 n=1 Tax=Hippocampus zosterae TaxID=109293 RepID=UPI00223D450D|nr:28S ribosomal protein S11, mitochondrial isoform X1 [Hippocampus zosterae]
MFKLACSVVTSLSTACRQASTKGTSFSRTFHGTAVGFQEVAASSKDSSQVSRDFSHFPPLPGHDSPLRWGGKKFEELPILHIKATYNNTHIQLTDCEGQSLVRTSCGTEGFKNIKKSTPVAAQTAAISAAAKSTAKGVTFVRVIVKGLGPGRLSAIKGLTMGGLVVVSITDNTPVPHNGCRPRKARRM